MTTENAPSCFIVGADSLLMECGDTLLRHGFHIRGVITANDRIARWARDKQLNLVDAAGDYKAALAEQPFDFLFSITHLSLLPNDVITMPRRFAVNFHDGPLPDYAGLNTPAWALLNQEPRYGIAWHVITPELDAGDILKQARFDVAPHETSLSLNTRCFEVAIETFGELALELKEGRETRTPQDTTGRRFFTRHDRPDAGCALDWRKPAASLEALVRALDFGPYPNPLGFAKVRHGNQCLLVRRAEARDASSEATPGEVLHADNDAIEVATADGSLALLELTCPLGNPWPLPQLRDALGIVAGTRFEVLDDAARGSLTQLGRRLADSEAFWLRRLKSLEPAELPQASVGAPDAAAPEVAQAGPLIVQVPPTLPAPRDAARAGDAVVAAIVAYLGRINDKTCFDVAYQDATLRDAIVGNEAWVLQHVPLRAELPASARFSELHDAVCIELDRVRERTTCWRDAIPRAPDLGSRHEIARGELLPVAILQVAQPPEAPSPGSTLTLAVDAAASRIHLIYDAARLSARSAGLVQAQLQVFLENLGADPDAKVDDIPMLDKAGRDQVLKHWNATSADYRRDVCVHQLFEAQVDRTPDAVAVVFEGSQLSYRELDAKANQMAYHLRQLGVGPDKLVGVCVERSLELMVCIMGVLKAGGAYVPLDPAYPKDRLAFMLEDSQAPVLLTQAHLADALPSHAARVVRIDSDWPQIAKHPRTRIEGAAQSQQLAYVIYTSGSTGKPKGVMVEHRNVVNFFRGMDDRISYEPGSSWLAVTSLSFDISVLELFWTLSHGFKVVVYVDRERGATSPPSPRTRPVDFSVFLWGSDDKESSNKYRLMLDAARFADTHGFAAVWTPERHFHAFGGPYPNPSVTGAAIGAVTSRLQVRAGSCVVPLHHPVRVAEEWAVIDNLTEGRVGISFASGWQPDDFLLRPENFKDAKQVMLRDIDVVRRLWRGEKMAFPGPLGKDVELVTQPRPVQRELPFWVTTAGNPDTYRQAGTLGANVLTHLLGQTLDEVGEKIRVYREARAEAGYDPDSGIVSLMLHTYVGDDTERVRELVRGPMKEYLGSSVSLVKNFAWAFPAFKRPKGEAASPNDVDLASLSPEELDAILDFAFERYFETSGLFGTPERCLEMIEKARAAGVNDVACLIDFGVPTVRVLEGLVYLDQVREMAGRGVGEVSDTSGDFSLPAQLRDQQVTHMQCTPSMARMLLIHDEARHGLKSLKHLMVGGEAFPVELARELNQVLSQGTVTNMYGPTETTIWSSTQRVTGSPTTIPIGRPIANTQLYILDKRRQPLPVGVPGELYIAGDGVVRGYHDRPELTDERFVPDPFAGTPGARMYRTGDLARFREDGVVEFLGRTDHQVKIRGYRIELGEIETLLNRHAAVREGVVMAREDVPGDQRLVAYFVPEGPTPDLEGLKQYLRSKLPEYMVPSHLLALASLPLTPNGKIDRKALPAVNEQNMAAAPAAYVAPEGELAEVIATAWQETLGLERVGMDDNFFDIGGHSLLVVRLHRVLKERVAQPIALTDLYRFPTIRLLTDHLSSDSGNELMQQSADRASRRRDMLQKRRKRLQPV